jgi:hypothetical protein
MVEMSFSEIHFHLLPGVDDGPSSIEETVELTRMAVADGTRTIVATPHVNGLFGTDLGRLADGVRMVSERLRRERVERGCCAAASLLPRGWSTSPTPSSNPSHRGRRAGIGCCSSLL